MDTTIDKYDYWLLRKPLQGNTVAENVLQHGVGGLNIDGCRVGTGDDISDRTTGLSGASKTFGQISKAVNSEAWKNTKGRWPANVIHDGSEEVTELFPEVKGSKGDEKLAVKGQSGIYGWNTAYKDKNNSTSNKTRGVKDSGSASRFFYKVDYRKCEIIDNIIQDNINEGDTMDDIDEQFNARVKLYLGNCLDVLKTMESNSVDSIVTDPPAGISFMNKQWDTDHGHRDQWIAYFAEIAKECLRVIKPGGHALVWAIPRTSHWTATAWENGGWEVRDRIIYCFGSGFPKSHNISKAIDKLAGAERDIASTAPATDAAKQWDGWGTALKPAVEDWWLLRKPLSNDTIAENVLEHGVGGLNIDGCRVEGAPSLPGSSNIRAVNDRAMGAGWDQTASARAEAYRANPPSGRWPANMIHNGSEEVTELFPDVKGSKGSGLTQTKARSWKNTSTAGINRVGHDDSGSAARFFYTAKASKSDRNEGLTIKNTHATVKPVDLMQYLCRLITPPNGIVLDPFMGSGSTGKACMLEGFRFIGVEMEEEYAVIARARIIHALKPEVQEYYKKKQSKSKKVKETANEEINDEGDLS